MGVSPSSLHGFARSSSWGNGLYITSILLLSSGAWSETISACLFDTHMILSAMDIHLLANFGNHKSKLTPIQHLDPFKHANIVSSRVILCLCSSYGASITAV